MVKNISTFDRNNSLENIFYLIGFQKDKTSKRIVFFEEPSHFLNDESLRTLKLSLCYFI